jgi:ubiquinone/menaquinone biosynthesis C-methylase UbiE
MQMNERFIFPVEYHDYHIKLGGLRKRIASDISISPGMHILDVGTGCGYFAIDLAACDPGIRIIGVDGNEGDIETGKMILKDLGLESRIDLVKMDMSHLEFPDERFDMGVSFLGVEEIYIRYGRSGVESVCKEVFRVVRPGGTFHLVVMPPEKMETEAQKLEMEVYGFIFNVNWMTEQEYSSMLEGIGFRILKNRSIIPEGNSPRIRQSMN